MAEVTIDLSQNKNATNQGGTSYYGYTTGTGKLITVTRYEDPSGFCKYKHEDSASTGKTAFILKEVKGDCGNSTNGIPMNISVLSVSSYYWKHENGTNSTPTTALMVEVIERGGAKTYYGKSNSGKDWTGPLHNTSVPPLINGDIERTLDDLVCEHHNAVTMNLSHNTSSSRASSTEPYCCRCHGIKDSIDQRKITVKQKNVFCKHRKKANYYEHYISGNCQLSKIRYYLKDTYTNTHSNRRRIKPDDLSFPMDGVQAVYAFYCGGNPVLIYVKGDGNNGTNSWYKKPTSNGNTYEPWEKVGLKGITPENSGNLGCREWNELINYLRDCGLKECPQDTLKLEQQSQESHSAGGPELERSRARSEKTEDSSLLGAASPPEPKGPDGNKGAQEDTANGKGDSGDGGKVEGAKGTEDSYPSDSKAGDDGYDGVGSTVTSQHTFSPDLATNTQVEGSEAASNSSGGAPDTTPLKPPEQQEANPGAAFQENPELPKSPTPQPVIGLAPPIGIALVASSVFGGSGAAGFLGYKGYKFYQSFKGDPWVRQI